MPLHALLTTPAAAAAGGAAALSACALAQLQWPAPCASLTGGHVSGGFAAVFFTLRTCWVSVQGRLSELRSGRLDYDSERRKLVQRATAATSSHSEHAGTSLDPALAQLTEEAAAINSECHTVTWQHSNHQVTLGWGTGGGVTASYRSV
jgi:hypothetical protein